MLSKVFDKDKSQGDLSNDLSIMNEWVIQWKKQFNPDPNKQVNKVYFSGKPNTDDYIPTKLNNSSVKLCE